MKNRELRASEISRRLVLGIAVLAIGNVRAAAADQAAFTEQPVTFSISVAEASGTKLWPIETNQVPCVVILGGTLSQTRDGGLTEKNAPPRNALKRLPYLKGMATRLEGRRQKGQEIFRLQDLPTEHPARKLAREVNPNFETANSRDSGSATVGRIGFELDEPGRLPQGWVAAITGVGAPRWNVVSDTTAPSPPNVLKQSGEVPKPSYPLCFKEGSSIKDGFVEAKFKAVRGKVDQAAGVVWRVQNSTNYYVCRANALEDNVVLYRVEAGQRKALDIVGRTEGYGVDTKVTPASWHTLRVEFVSSRFTVFLDGARLFEVEDGTFADAGMVGLWTKADSVTLFDDFGYGGN